MNILLLGSGGRESALAWKIKQSDLTDSLFIAPGNGGTGAYGTNVALSPLDFEAVDRFVADNGIANRVSAASPNRYFFIYSYLFVCIKVIPLNPQL